MISSETSPCSKCRWWNATIRMSCRNCEANLTMHPDATIDREVRLDFAECILLEESIQIDQ